MTTTGALVLLIAVSWATALPSPPQLAFPEDVRDNSMGRIVSGWEAREGEIPYQLSIRMISPQGVVVSCGATLIDNEWALTAAHCTANRVSIVVRAGLISLIRPSIIFETTEFYNHPLYIEALPFVQPHDIGLIKLNRFVEYTDLIQPIRLQSSFDMNKNYGGIRLAASGWGRTWTNGNAPEILNWVYLTGESNQACNIAFPGSTVIVPSTICASGYNVSSQSTCQGDSGGPLLTRDADGQLTQVGVSSFVSSSGCHTPIPAGFIRPGHYHGWFEQITGKSFDWDPTQLTTTTTTTSTAAPEEDDSTTSIVDTTTDAGEEIETTVLVVETTTDAGEEIETTVLVVETTTDAGEEIETTVSDVETTTDAGEEIETTVSDVETTADAGEEDEATATM